MIKKRRPLLLFSIVSAVMVFCLIISMFSYSVRADDGLSTQLTYNVSSSEEPKSEASGSDGNSSNIGKYSSNTVSNAAVSSNANVEQTNTPRTGDLNYTGLITRIVFLISLIMIVIIYRSFKTSRRI